jgi:hypothetical protein
LDYRAMMKRLLFVAALAAAALAQAGVEVNAQWSRLDPSLRDLTLTRSLDQKMEEPAGSSFILIQWQTPNHSVPIGRGAGVTGFGNVVPGVSGLPFVSNGASADPSYQVLPNSGLANMPANTAKCNNTSGSASPIDCTSTQLATALGLALLPATNVQTANYTIANSDCGKTVQAGTGSSGLFTLTLPATAGFPAGCIVGVVNGDNTRGKKLSGFPNGLVSPNILWPLKTFTVQVINGGWTLIDGDGRWVFPAAAGSPFPNAANTQTVFVGGTGSNDGNDGLAAGVGAFATLQAAVNAAAQYFDLAGQNLVFQIADGTYSQANSVHLWSLVGQLTVGGHTEVIIRGNIGSLGNVTLSATGAGQHTIATVGLYPPWRIEGIKFQSTSGLCVSADGQSFLYLGTNQYDSCALGHVNASYKSFVEMFAPYTVSAGAPFHIQAGAQSQILLVNGTITLTGTPNFSEFVLANNLSYIESSSGTVNFSGSATGTRLVCGANSIIQTFGGGVTYFPGNVNGVPATGCLYQ